MLLKTREMMLSRRGYLVTTAQPSSVDVEAACKTSDFDLFVLGHSIPLPQKVELIRTFRKLSPAPILSLLRFGDPAEDGADGHLDPYDPEALLKLVDAMLKDRSDAASM
jgi:DNA-binding response OmpR family regulator